MATQANRYRGRFGLNAQVGGKVVIRRVSGLATEKFSVKLVLPIVLPAFSDGYKKCKTAGQRVLQGLFDFYRRPTPPTVAKPQSLVLTTGAGSAVLSESKWVSTGGVAMLQQRVTGVGKTT